MSTARLKIIGGRIGIANAFARMPFRFGVVTMEAAASATLELEVFVTGHAGGAFGENDLTVDGHGWSSP